MLNFGTTTSHWHSSSGGWGGALPLCRFHTHVAAHTAQPSIYTTPRGTLILFPTVKKEAPQLLFLVCFPDLGKRSYRHYPMQFAFTNCAYCCHGSIVDLPPPSVLSRERLGKADPQIPDQEQVNPETEPTVYGWDYQIISSPVGKRPGFVFRNGFSYHCRIEWYSTQV